MPDYKVDLDIYRGPLDLLLYLIRRDEVEISDIPIASITDQYLNHLTILDELNINVAGEFLVMASTLMEIKSRMLLPRPEPLEDDEDDPRAELVRQLLEYKKFKEAAGTLSDRFDLQSDKFTHPAPRPDEEPADLGEVLQDVNIWNLLTAYTKILEETSADKSTTIVYDDVPVEVRMEQVLERLQALKAISFFDLFDNTHSRVEVISIFLAILELIRLRKIAVEQTRHFGNIRIVLKEEESPSTSTP